MASTSSSETPPDIPAIAVLENGFVDYYELMQVREGLGSWLIIMAYGNIPSSCPSLIPARAISAHQGILLGQELTFR